MLKLNTIEWQVVLDAYLYEIEESPISSDQFYDTCCKLIDRQKVINIPDFDSSTGIWIYSLVEKYPQIKIYARNLLKMGEGTAILHVVPSEFIRPYNEKAT